MKKLFLFAVAAVSIAACSKKEIAEEIQGPAPVYDTVIKASAESFTDTKAAYNDVSGAFSWVLGDKFDVFTAAGNKVFTCTNVVESSFSGNLDGATPGIAAFYPSGNGSLDGKELTVNLPASSEWTESAATPMVAMISDGDYENISFKHLAGAVRIAVTNVPPTATQFVLSTSSRIAGTFTISDCTVDECEIATDATDSGKEVTLTFPAAGDFTDKTFYVPVPTGDYAYFEVRIKDEWGNTLAGRRYTNDDAGFSIERTDLAGDAVTLQMLVQRSVLRNDTQLGVQWSVANYANNATDRGKEWTFGIYSNSLCSPENLLWEWHTDGNAIKPSSSTTLAASGNLFTGICGHQFSGLAAGETYYVRISDKTDGISSVASYTMEAEDPNFVLDETASAGDIILSQNFNELKWGGGDPVYSLTGYSTDVRNSETPQANPSGVQYWYNKEEANGSSKQFLVQTGTDMGLFSTIKSSITPTSLNSWCARYKNETNPNACSGYVRFNGSGYLVSPSLTCLPGESTVRVTFIAKGQNADRDVYVAVFPADVAATTGRYISTDPVSEHKVSEKVVQSGWNTYSIDITLSYGQRIGIGSPIGDDQMFYLNDIKAECVSTVNLAQKLEYVNNSQIAVRWSTTRFQTPAADLNKAYTFGIYTDAGCTSPVYRTFSTTADNKDASATAQTAFVSGYCPGFVFSGLASGQDYYVKIVQGAMESIEKYSTTNLYPGLNPVKTGSAVAGDVILFEDFNEIMFTGDFISKLSGYWTSGDYSTGYFGLPVAYSAGKGNYIHQAVDQSWNLLSGAWGGSTNAKTWLDGTSSFKNWNYYNTAPVSGPGYLKVYGDGQLRQIVSPQINCLSGKGTVKVRVRACASSGVKVVVKVFPASVDVSKYKITTAPLDTPTPIQLTVNTYTSGWSYAEGTISLEPGQRIGLAATGQAWIDEVKVELVSYD